MYLPKSITQCYNHCMKNFIFIITIIFISFGIIYFDIQKKDIYSVLKVQKGDTFYVDFNHNSIADFDELIKLDSVESFAMDNSEEALNQEKLLKISHEKLMTMGYLSKEFSKDLLLNQEVKVKIIDKSTHPKKAKVYFKNTDFSGILLENGYALDTNGGDRVAVIDNLKMTKNLDLVYLNKNSMKYHNLDCKYIHSGDNFELVERFEAIKITKEEMRNSNFKTIACITDEKNNPYFADGSLSLYFTNPNLFYDAPDACRTALCKELLASINEAQNSIDFAIYGVEGQSKIVNALKKAQDRGVKIRWVTDFDSKGNASYPNTKKTIKLLPNCITDFARNNSSNIMHNKFFIIDSKTLITGSANLSNTDLGGLNSNVFLKINSPEICTVFQEEFEQMYQGQFHKAKKIIENKSDIKLANNNVVSVYFSPKDKAISKALIPLIDDAHEYIYVPIFFLTDKNMVNALICAKKRGVEIKVLLDAVAAQNAYSKHKELRAAGISVKVENWAGKMHQKSMIIDDKTVVIGSMNFSKSGENCNDENCIIVKNAPKLAKKYKQHFLILYNSVPNKWLKKDPSPESPDSIGSCSDGVDNDFDGLIDSKDSGCFKYKKR